MIVVTASGSIYQFSLDTEPMTVCRIPRVARTELTGNETFKSEHLRRDGEPITLLEKPEIGLGKPIDMLIRVREDGVNTVRSTTPVVGIEAG